MSPKRNNQCKTKFTEEFVVRLDNYITPRLLSESTCAGKMGILWLERVVIEGKTPKKAF